MKLLPAGTTKYLLLAYDEIVRNVHRGAKQAPIVHVVVVEGDRETQHVGYGVLVEGPVTVTYDQHRFAGYDGRDGFHAAFTTTGAVALAETRDEQLALAEKPAKTTIKKDTK